MEKDKININVYDQKILDIGYELVKNSLSITNEISKLMLTVNFTAIPTFIALVNLKKNDYENINNKNLILIVSIVFLCSGLCFFFSLIPRKFELDFRIPSRIIEEKDKLLTKKMRCIYIGSLLFTIGIIGSSILLII